MEHRSIDLPELFKYSFQQYQQYASFVIGVMITYYVLAIIPQAYLLLHSPAEPTTARQILSGALITVQLFLSLGFIRVMLLLVDNRPVQVSDLFNNFSCFLSYFLAYFIYIRALLDFDVGGASAGGVIAIILANIVAIFLVRTVAKNLET